MPKRRTDQDKINRRDVSDERASHDDLPSNDETPNHREDFMRLLAAAARRRESKD
jgi:hypothetical protein